MPEATTLGRAVTFIYNGSVPNGVEIIYETSTTSISAGFFSLILRTFKGKRVVGGFLRDNPIPHGFGEWIEKNSTLNTDRLSPQHGSRVAAILVKEGYATSEVVNRRVYLVFK